jgi:hypothetical protein
VFVFHSLVETFGIVFAQAMASGLPIVAANTSCVPAVVYPQNGDLDGFCHGVRRGPPADGDRGREAVPSSEPRPGRSAGGCERALGAGRGCVPKTAAPQDANPRRRAPDQAATLAAQCVSPTSWARGPTSSRWRQ